MRCFHPVPMASFLLLASAAISDVNGQSGATVPGSVEEFRSAFESAVRARDVDSWSELFAADGILMAPSGRVVEGREAFHRLWSRTFEGQTGPNPLSVEIVEARVSGEIAVVRADYGPQNADPVGQYVWLLERGTAGSWKLKWWIFNRTPG